MVGASAMFVPRSVGVCGARRAIFMTMIAGGYPVSYTHLTLPTSDLV